MVWKMICRFFYVLVAIAIIGVTVVPGFSTSVGGEEASNHAMVTSPNSPCAQCPKTQGKMAGCIQVSCIGFAVLNDQSISHLPLTHTSYIVVSAFRPNSFNLALITPPI